MATLSPGSICTIRQFGARLWVAVEPAPDHMGEPTRWKMMSRQVDNWGRLRTQFREAGIGDITTIRDAETYAVGDTVRYQDLDLVILEDRGDSIEVGVPAHRVPTEGTELIRIPSGNVRVIPKADLILAGMQT